jgi:hypothetical protein
VWSFALVVMAVTTVPYLAGYAQQGSEWVFTGFVFGADDGNSYIAKMLSGAAGAWLFRTPYTTFPQQGVAAYLPYLLLGKLASSPAIHVQLVALFHLFRFAAGVLALLATYDFLSVFLHTINLRRWCLILATLGGGLGWVLVLIGGDMWLGSLPLEFYSPESFGFLALYGLPHLAVARALLLWALTAYLADPPGVNALSSGGEPARDQGFLSWLAYRGDRGGRMTPIRAGVFLFLLGLFQPLTIVIAWTVMVAHLFLYGLSTRVALNNNQIDDAQQWWRSFRRALWVGLISSPFVFYSVVTLSRDPFLKTWTSQNLILSPHPYHYLLAYGLLIPLVVVGAKRLMGRDPRLGAFLTAWVLLLPFLAYAPYNLQRRLPEGIWVGLVGLAGAGLEQFEPLPIARWLGRLWTGLLFPSTLILVAGGLLAVQVRGSPLFRQADEVRMFERLAEEGRPSEIVLSAFETGNPLPAWAPMRVVVGHGPESVQLSTILPQVQSVFTAATPEADRKTFIHDYNVNYIFWGPAERKLGNWDPREAAFLELLAHEGDYWLFKVLE